MQHTVVFYNNGSNKDAKINHTTNERQICKGVVLNVICAQFLQTNFLINDKTDKTHLMMGFVCFEICESALSVFY
jgi:hypothetical protein